MQKKKILGAAIGNCVHVAGVAHFLALAEKEGFTTLFLGPAVSVEALFSRITEHRPEIIALSYRLTPENAHPLLEAICERAKDLDYTPIWTFGGTKPVADVARSYPLFSFISDGTDDINDSIRFLRGGESAEDPIENYGKTIIERIEKNYPYPVLRHHFGLSSLGDTIKGIGEIAQAKVLDVISLGPDQNAQQFFFQPSLMKKEFDGAGGVPIRTKEDLSRLKQASRCGNYPLIRCYSGTEDVFAYAPMLIETIDNAWAAIPLCWYNELDGRGRRHIETSIVEAHKLVRWHAERNIPVELNEPHHWGLRDAHDVIAVAMAYISAYTAKKLGVRHYIAQYMFNNPNGLSYSMDLARVLAMVEMVESLQDETFTTYRETRAGLALFSADMDVAKGQLASSTFMQMVIKPHIMHVVAYCEADHAASPQDVIASCKIVKGVIRHTMSDSFSIENDGNIQRRKKELISEASYLLQYIREKYAAYDDPLANPEVLAECIKNGYLDAVHIVKNNKFRGTLTTKFENGKCVAYDKGTGCVLSESERLRILDVSRL